MIDITQGNDFNMFATFTRDGAEYRFDTVTGVSLISSLGKKQKLSYSYNGGVLTMRCTHELPSGTYGVEVTGTEGDDIRRTAFASVLTIGYITRRGDSGGNFDCDDYDIKMSVQLERPTARLKGTYGMSVRGLLSLYASVPWGHKVEVRQNVGGEVLSTMTGLSTTGGMGIEELAALQVEWADPVMGDIATAAWGKPLTYADLIGMSQADADEWAQKMLSDPRHTSATMFPEYHLMTQLSTALYLGRWTRLGFMELPISVTTIGINAFCYTQVGYIDNASVTGLLGSQAFCGCTALTSVSLPNVTSMGSQAFYGCTALTSVSLPNVTSMEYRAFSGCTALTSVSLPNVTTMRGDVFLNSSLTSLTLGPVPPPSAGRLPATCVVYVPSEAVEKYKEATAWKSYTIKSIDEKTE